MPRMPTRGQCLPTEGLQWAGHTEPARPGPSTDLRTCPERCQGLACPLPSVSWNSTWQGGHGMDTHMGQSLRAWSPDEPGAGPHGLTGSRCGTPEWLWPDLARVSLSGFRTVLNPDPQGLKWT